MAKRFSLDPIKLLKSAADTKSLKAGKQIHAHFVVTSDVPSTITDVVKINSLINLYAKCGRISIARQLFDRMPERNVVSWSALMAGYFHDGSGSEVVGLFKTMVSSGDVGPNEFVLTTVVSSCSGSGRAAEGKQCHGYALKSGLVFHLHVKNALVHMYSRLSLLGEAKRVYDTVPGLDIFSYNSAMNGLLENGNPIGALEVLRTMVAADDMAWDSVTYATSFVLCSTLGSSKLGREVHCRLLKTYDIDGVGDAHVQSSLMDMYGKCGELSGAVRVFDRLPGPRGTIAWTTIMAAHLQNDLPEEALSLFTRMRAEGVGPNEYTLAVVLNSSALLTAVRNGGALHACAERSGLGGHVTVGNALVNMYAKGGDIGAAREVFSGMRFRDRVTWNVMISGFSRHGLGDEALGTFREMMGSGEIPDQVTFLAVLSGCASLGSPELGWHYLSRVMRRFGVEPGVEHHTCVVGMLGRAGRVEEAMSYMSSSKTVKWDLVAWRSLLGACYLHRKYSIGGRVGAIAVAMDPSDAGTYLELSNMYATAGQWDQVAWLRRLMSQLNVKKEPGGSWVETGNTTHVFVSDDNSQSESARVLLPEINPAASDQTDLESHELVN